MKNNDPIDELFREKLQDYQEEPRAGLFDEVLAGVAAERNRRKLLFWRIGGIAAALLLAFIAGWQFSNRNQKLDVAPVLVQQSTVNENQEQTANQQEEKTTAPATLDSFSEKKEKNTVVPATDFKAGVTKEETAKFASLKNSPTTSSPNDLQASSEKPDQIRPMKSLYHLLAQAKAENELREKKAIEARSEELVKSIDQQIMEQNQKNYLADLTAKKRGRWLIGAQFSPAYSLDRGSYSQAYANNMISASNVNPIDLGGGLSLEYKTNKRLSLQTGIYYASIGQSSGNSVSATNLDLAAAAIAPSNSYSAPVSIQSNKVIMNSSAGVIEMDQVPESLELNTSMDGKEFSSTMLVPNAQFIQDFQYIEVPIYLRYALFDSRFDIEMLGGFSSNILIGNDTYLQNGSTKSLIGSTQDMRTFNYSGTLGIGFKYGLSKHFFLNVEPRVKYFLNSLNTNSSVKYKPYIFGVYTGVSYEF